MSDAYVEDDYVEPGYVEETIVLPEDFSVDVWTTEALLNSPGAMRDHGEWLVEVYLTDANGFEYVFKTSRRGTAIGNSDIIVGDDIIYANSPYRKRLIQAPTITQSVWAPGQILASSSLPTSGSIIWNNQDGGLDEFMVDNGYRWINARVKAFYCHQLYIAETIFKVFDGFAKDPQYSLTQVTLDVVGHEGKFEQELKMRVYRGAEYALELFGDRTVDFGTPAALNTRSDMTWVGWLWFDALPTINPRRFAGWFLSGSVQSPFQIAANSTGKLDFRCSFGGIEDVTTGAFTFIAQRFYHVAWIVNGLDITLVIFDEHNYTETIETFVGALPGLTRDTFPVGASYVWRSASDATFRPWFDEAKHYNVALSIEQVRQSRWKPLSTPYPASLVHYAKCNNGTGTTVSDSSATGANGTISGAGTSTWLWLHEGTEELAGTPKLDSFGQIMAVDPVLVDPINNGYQVAGNGTVQSIAPAEGGLTITSDGNATSFRDYIVTAPAVGRCRTYLARGLFKIRNQPTLPVSAFVEGYNDGYDNEGNPGLARRPQSVARYLVTKRGPRLADPGDIEVDDFTVPLSDWQPIIGFCLKYDDGGNSKYKVKDGLDYTLRAMTGWYGYRRAQTLFHIERYTGPSVTPDYRLTDKRILGINQLKWPGIIYEVIVRYRPNYVVMSEDQVAASIKGTVGWEQWTKPYLETTPYTTDSSLKDHYAGSGGISLIVDTPLYYEADATALAEYVWSLVGGVKVGWSVDINSAGLEISHGDSVTIDVSFLAGINRLGLDGGESFYVFTVMDNRQEGKVRLDVWRNLGDV